MKPSNFSFVHAQSTQHVFELLDEYGEEAKIISGGQSLVPTLNMRLSAPEILIDISALDELRGIRQENDRLIIGALTRHVELQNSDLVAQHIPLVSMAIEHVAHAAIRNRGTIGGNLSLADPASELPACTVALDAEITLANKSGQRTVRAREYFKDLYETELQADDILMSVSFPVATEKTRSGFREFVRRRGDFSSTGLVINADWEDGQFSSFSPVFFAISNTPVLAKDTAAVLVGKTINEDLIEAALAVLDKELDVIGDIHTPEAMKMHLARHYFKELTGELSV